MLTVNSSINNYLLVYKILPPKYEDSKYAFIVVFPLLCTNVNYTYINNCIQQTTNSSIWQYINKYTVISTTNILQSNSSIKEHTNKSIDINGENIAKGFVSNQTNNTFIIYGLQNITKQIKEICDVNKTKTLVIPISWDCRKNNQKRPNTTLTSHGLLYKRLFNYSDFPSEIFSRNISTHLITNKHPKNCVVREHIKRWLYNNTGEPETCSPKYETTVSVHTISTSYVTTSMSSTNTGLSSSTRGQGLSSSLASKSTLRSPISYVSSSSPSYTLEDSSIKTPSFLPPIYYSTGSAGKW
uniref:Ser/thr-rich glycoprotein ORF-Q n=1 Tax=Elephant endotheliotropic herpesvirus 1A TaxID=759753 RepID=A0A482K8B1_ELHV1|nr:ser/thr-rich glycoprotein ORF-Q [Elephant endotheliotropic herpesvirus 1A]